ncbi:MAG TPA: CsgG/HfaB family protein [Candidatus Hydrogenedens sp.]|nr:CsgG/HfaB family protein [Candidatus Hydrogenedens sp.]
MLCGKDLRKDFCVVFWTVVFTLFVCGSTGLAQNVTVNVDTGSSASSQESSNDPVQDATADAKSKPGKMIVAIGKFENKSNAPDELFQRLRTRITDEIVNTRKFEVVEREQMDELISEDELVKKGVIQGEDPDKPSELVAAGYKIYGSVLFLGLDSASGTVGNVTAKRQTAKVDIQLRFADLKTGKILASKEVNAKSSNADVSSYNTSTSGNYSEGLIEDAIKKASLEVTNALMELAYPIKIIAVKGDTVYINIPQERAKIEEVYNVYDPGEELIDPDTGENLGATEFYVGMIKIYDIKPKYSIAVPTGNTKIEMLNKGMIVRPLNKEKQNLEKAREYEKKRKEFENKF